MLDLPSDPAAIEADLDLLDRSAALEAWHWTGEIGAAFAHPGWLARADERARCLAASAGEYGGDLQRAVSARLAFWRQTGR